MKTIGVVNIDPWFIMDDTDSLFTDLIYFDQVIYSIGHLKTLKELFDLLQIGNRLESKLLELEALEKAGLILEFDKVQHKFGKRLLEDPKVFAHSIRALELVTGFSTKGKETREMIKEYLETFREAGQLTSRAYSIVLNNTTTDNHVPVIRSTICNQTSEESSSTSTVMSVLVKQFPFVSNEISLDRLIDFKSDRNTQLQAQRLRDWALEISKKNYSTKEIEQKLDYLLHEYCKQLEIHELKYNLGVMETFIITSLEVLENVMKLNFSKAAKVIFELSKQDVNLLEAEQGFIGKEVALIHSARNFAKDH